MTLQCEYAVTTARHITFGYADCAYVAVLIFPCEFPCSLIFFSAGHFYMSVVAPIELMLTKSCVENAKGLRLERLFGLGQRPVRMETDFQMMKNDKSQIAGLRRD